MNEKKLREIAIQRYENGETPKQIYTSLGKGKTWFFKWLKRFKTCKINWAVEQSRRPYNSPKKTENTMEQAVIDTRYELEKNLYAQIGAFNIVWHLENHNKKAPSITTINRIIRRNNLTHKRPRYQPKGVNFPALIPPCSNFLHQFDIVGPRYLKSDGRFYSGNIVDAYDRRCCINPRRGQTNINIAKSLIQSWQTLGIPKYLQMDNMLPTQGSHRYPHSFGLVIRLCLKLGIQPVFIPIREPWRNGIVERFNDVFDKMFFRSQSFQTFTDVCQQASGFEYFHNQNHRYSTMGGKTPVQQMTNAIQLLANNFKIPHKLFIVPGQIHLFRFIRSNRVLDIFGEKFAMPMFVEYEYVKATINTANETLSVYHDSNLIEQYKYSLPKTSLDMSKSEE